MPAGYRSVILEFDDLDARARLADRIEPLGGQVVHQHHHMPYSTVRVPEDMADRVAGIAGARMAKDDLEISFTSSSSQQTSNHPYSDMIGPVPLVDTDMAVAVLDSGIDEHSDLNVARHLHFTHPHTEWADESIKHRLAQSYVFDEDGGTTGFDRGIKTLAGAHLTYRYSSAGLHPDNTPSSVMRSTENGIVTELDLQNDWSSDVVAHLIDNEDAKVELK